MGSLFRRSSTGPWIVRYFDANGRRCDQSTRTRDRRAAQRIADEITAKVALRRSGLIDPRAERVAEHGRKPVAEQLKDFGRFLAAKGNTANHVTETVRQIEILLDGCSVRTLADLTPARVQEWLGEQRSKLSARTLNKYLAGAKALCRWALRDGRIAASPLIGLDGFNVAADRRLRRRAFTADELERLFAAARNGRPLRGLSGQQREMLYRLAVGTGFRAGEIASLTRESFDLDASPPTITISAGYSKHRAEDVQPIREDLAEQLRPWVFALEREARLFDVHRLEKATAPMIRSDLVVAKIERKTDSGIGDFHALRHTFVSAIVRSGASVKVAQVLARHRTPGLTIGVYSHVELPDLAGALSALPAIASPAVEEVRATGTGGEVHPGKSPQNCPHSVRADVRSGALGRSPAVRGGKSNSGAGGSIPRVYARDSRNRMARPAGIEPATAGLENRKSSSQKALGRGRYDDESKTLHRTAHTAGKGLRRGEADELALILARLEQATTSVRKALAAAMRERGWIA